MNEIELLAFLTAPGRLEITIGGHTFSESATGGMTSFRIPTQPGTPTFSLVREGNTAISFSAGPQIYGASGVPTDIQDLTYWSGSASASSTCSHDTIATTVDRSSGGDGGSNIGTATGCAAAVAGKYALTSTTETPPIGDASCPPLPAATILLGPADGGSPAAIPLPKAAPAAVRRRHVISRPGVARGSSPTRTSRLNTVAEDGPARSAASPSGTPGLSTSPIRVFTA
jgi:hypothetical protein